MNTLQAAALGLAMATAGVAHAEIQITEWMYNGADATGEYVELTNLGPSAVDFTGWSFDDDSRTPGVTSLSAFGLVAAGQSVILTEATAAAFKTAWNLAASVKVVGSNAANLGRTDEINIFDAGGALVDRLTYGDQVIAGTVRTSSRSGNPGSLADLLPFTVTTGWVLASTGDSLGSYNSTLGDAGNPGVFALAVPEPASWALLLAGAGLIALRRRQTRD